MSSVTTIAHELKDIHQALQKLQGKKDAENLLLPLQERLREIDSKRRDGKFVAHDGNIPPGQAELVDALESCYQLVYNIETGAAVLESELEDIKSQLKKLETAAKVTHEDLRPLQDRLHAVESRRVDGKFADDDGNIPPGQAQLVGLLEECHEIKQKVMEKIK